MNANQKIAALFEQNMSRNFAVSIDKEKSERLTCQIIGPFLYVCDVNKISQPFTVYFPLWRKTTKKSSKHKTLIIEPQLTDIPVSFVKIKTKKIKTIDQWMLKMDKIVELVDDIKIGELQFNVRVNTKGSFVKATVSITNEKVVITTSREKLVELPRAPETFANIAFYEPLKVYFYLDKTLSAILLCKTEQTARSLCIALNRPRENMQTIPKVFLNHSDVPNIESSFQEGVMGLSESVQSLSTAIYSDGEISETSTVQTKEGFAVLMNHKLDKYESLPQNERPPERETVINELIMKSIKNSELIKQQPFPVIPYVADEDDHPIFNFEKNYHNETLFIDKLTEQPYEKVDLRTEFDFNKCYNLTMDGLDLGNNVFQVERPKQRMYDQLLSQIGLAADPDRLLIAAGILLQGLAVSRKTFAETLESAPFSITEITGLIKMHPFTDDASLVELLRILQKGQLVGVFFSSFENFVDIKENCYHVDALIRVDGFCMTISPIFDRPISCPPKQITGPLPIQTYHGPHLRILNSIPKMIANQTSQWIMNLRNPDSLDPFPEFYASLILLFGSECKGVNEGDLSTLYGNCDSIRKKIGPAAKASFENISKLKKSYNEKMIMFLTSIIAEKTVRQWILTYMITYKAPNQSRINAIYCLWQISNLHRYLRPEMIKYSNAYTNIIASKVKLILAPNYVKH